MNETSIKKRTSRKKLVLIHKQKNPAEILSEYWIELTKKNALYEEQAEIYKE